MSFEKSHVLKLYCHRLAKSLVPRELGEEYINSVADDLFSVMQGPPHRGTDISTIVNKCKARFLSNNFKEEWAQFQNILHSLTGMKTLDQIANYLVFLDALRGEDMVPELRGTTASQHVPRIQSRSGKTLAQLIKPYYDSLPEKEILTYLPYTLRGMDSKLVTFVDNYRQLEIPSTINESYSGMLRQLFEYALLFKQLSLLVEQDRANLSSAVHSAFVALIEEALKSYSSFLNEIFTRSPSSILSVYVDLSPWLPKLRFLYRMALRLGSLDGFGFLTYVYKFTKFGDDNISVIAKKAFGAMSLPYFKIVESWCVKGDLVDDHNEFFVSFDSTQTKFNNIIVYHRDKVPEFIQNFSEKVFQIGKTLIFLNRYCRELEWINQFYVKYSTKLFAPGRNGLVSMNENVKMSFIDEAFDEVLSFFTRTLHKKYNLLAHLINFKRYYLMEQNDFIESIMEKGQSTLNEPAVNITASQLDTILNDAIQASTVKNSQSIDRVDMKIFTSETGSYGWEAFLINYKIDDLPFSFLIEDQISDYLKMFHLLRKLRHLEMLLNSNYEMYSRLSRTIVNLTRDHQHKNKFRAIIGINLMRNHLKRVLSGLGSYLSYDVVEESFESIIIKRFFFNDNDTELLLDRDALELPEKMEEKFNVNKLTIDEIISTHGNYLHQIAYTDILNEEVVGRKSNMCFIYQIYDLLQTIYDFISADQEYHALVYDFVLLSKKSSEDFEAEDDLEEVLSKMAKVFRRLKLDIYQTEFLPQLSILKEDLNLNENTQDFGMSL
ncbi:uncharacterized protein LODBEIA_P09730 [Lodderomyces beijingensis]|uniref:Spindle pole body component n=1 Tax=Lodderomyces beijingensis TaxID=1775926 RepID=A0ABP0ZF10_9ASCO